MTSYNITTHDDVTYTVQADEIQVNESNPAQVTFLVAGKAVAVESNARRVYPVATATS